jgi:molecular chaperone DnaK
MVKDAESHANEDKERRERAEARNQADHISYQTEKMLQEHGDKVGDAERGQVQEKLDELKKVLEDTDASAERLRGASEAVMTASQVIGQKIYEASQQEAEAAAAGGEASDGGDEVVDAEIVDEGEEA